MPFRYLGDIATADAAFEAWGETLSALLKAAADALLGVMIADIGSVRPRVRREIALEAGTLELLLFEFLGELIYLKDTERLFARAARIEVLEDGGTWRLAAELAGEEVDGSRHDCIVDVKAVTLHRFAVSHAEGRWTATVVVDT